MLGGIPTPLVGHMLDYLPYEAVEEALEAAEDEKVRREIQKHATALNITSGSQLDASLADRFENAEEVNCLSFLVAADDSPDDERILVVCRETATRLVPVLSTFRKLRRIYVGGGLVETGDDGIARLVREEYWHDRRNGRHRLGVEPHLSLASMLAYQLIGALKARVIPPLERMDGVADLFHADCGANTLCPGFDSAARPLHFPRVFPSEDAGRMCEHCRDVCLNLPLEDIACNVWSSSCVDKVVLFETMAARDRTRTKELLCDPNGWCVDYVWEVVHQELWDNFYLEREDSTAEAKELAKRLQGLGVGECDVWYMDRSSLSFIDRMISAGWQPDACSSWYPIYGSWFSQLDCIAKSTYDALVSRGFLIDKSDCIVIDELAEPALRDLPALMSRWFIRRY